MIYIEKVILENFQSHDYTELEFGPKVNAIIGPSDSGKTAVIRGIRWALYNEPQGDYFVRNGEDEARVTVIFNTGFAVRRGREKQKNYYDIRVDGDVRHYEGFGSSVPAEVFEETGIRPIDLDKNITTELNISDQLEPPFLLTQTPSTKSDAVGRLSGVHIIDKALSDLSKDINRSKRKIRSEKERSEEKKKQLEEYKDLDEEIRATKRQTEIVKEIRRKKALKQRLTDLKKSEENNGKGIEETEKILAATAFTEKLLPKIRALTEYEKRLRYFRGKKETKQSLEREIGYLEKVLKKQNKILEAKPCLEQLEDTYGLLSRYRLLKNNLEKNGKRQAAEQKILAENNPEELKKRADRLDELRKRRTRLDGIRKRYADVSARIEKGNAYMKRFEGLDAANRKKERLSTRLPEYRRLRDLSNRLRQNSLLLEKEKRKRDEFVRKENAVIEEYADALRREKRCPYCFGTVDEAHISEIISRLKGEPWNSNNG